MPNDRVTIDYYFSFLSLWSYLGSALFKTIANRHDARIVFKPIDLMAVFAASGGKPVRERPLARQAYRLVEMKRWSTIRDVPVVTWPKHYPVDPSLGHRMLLAALEEGRDVHAFAHACLKGVWADELDIADADTLIKLADASGLDGRRLLDRQDDPALVRQEQQLTKEAIGRQVFGAPFYVLRGEPFWGQDRLELLDQFLSSGRSPVPWPDMATTDR